MSWFRKPSSTPLWRDEFSGIHSRRTLREPPAVHQVSDPDQLRDVRRQPVDSRAIGYSTAPLRIRGCRWRRLTRLAVGGVKIFAYPTADDPCILVRTGHDSYVAYSQKCTHLSCAVYYEKEQNRLECPCHQGFFSIADGSVLQGPPQRALPRVALEKRAGHLVAIRMEGEAA